MACRISDYLKAEWIITSLQATTKEEVLREIAEHVGRVSTVETEELFAKLLERERKASTGADQGLAIPHATIQSASTLMVVLGRSKTGLDFGAIDNEKSQFFFTIVNPAKPPPGQASHLQVISCICRLMRVPMVRERLRQGETPEELLAAVLDVEQARLGGAPL